eukprot:753930-Pyramimonas_sp.AAC.1
MVMMVVMCSDDQGSKNEGARRTRCETKTCGTTCPCPWPSCSGRLRGLHMSDDISLLLEELRIARPSAHASFRTLRSRVHA